MLGFLANVGSKNDQVGSASPGTLVNILGTDAARSVQRVPFPCLLLSKTLSRSAEVNTEAETYYLGLNRYGNLNRVWLLSIFNFV